MPRLRRRTVAVARVTAAAALAIVAAGAPAAGAAGAGAAGAGAAVPAPGCGETAVSVVVDPGPLGGEVTQRCADDGGGRTVAELTDLAGFEIELVPGAGLVCRVDGRPGPDTESCSRTPPADAYWGLFWAPDGDSPWTYATLGATALTVPTGGAVGWRWQDGGDEEEPPAVSRNPATGDAAPDDAAPDDAAQAETGGEETSHEADERATDEGASSDGAAGVPTWAASLVVIAVVGAVVVLVRRRRG